MAIAQTLLEFEPRADIRAFYNFHRDGESVPEAIVRLSPTDSGTVFEFKTLVSDRALAVKRNLAAAAKQLAKHDRNGEVWIDGRISKIREDEARLGYKNFADHAPKNGQTIPRMVTVILDGGRLLRLERKDNG